MKNFLRPTIGYSEGCPKKQLEQKTSSNIQSYEDDYDWESRVVQNKNLTVVIQSAS